MAAETVTLPAVGQVKRTWLYVGVAAAGGIVAYAWWRRSAGSGEPDPVEPVDEGVLNDYPVDEYRPPGGGPVGGSDDVDDVDAAPTTNREWTTRATDYLATVVGYEAATVSAAIAKVFARETVSKEQQQIWQEAVAAMGPPPEGGPWPVTVTPTPATLPAPTGLRQTNIGRSTATVWFSWSPVAGAQGYTYYSNRSSQTAGWSDDTDGTISGLKPGQAIQVWVYAIGASQKLGAKSAVVTMKTAKK